MSNYQKNHNRKVLLAGHLGKLEQVTEIPYQLKFCQYLDNCTARKNLRDKNLPAYCFGDNIENCQTYKFYKKYPNWEELGIGSRV